MARDIRISIDRMPWLIRLLLVIFFDGIVGGLYRVGGKRTLTRVVGWIMVISFILSVVSFISLPQTLASIVRVVTGVCLVADIVTVLFYKKILLFAA